MTAFEIGGLLFATMVAISIAIIQRSRPRVVRYQMRSIKLVSTESAKLIEGLEVRVDGKPVEEVSLTKFIIWNDSDELIDASHLVPSDPLRLKCQENRILTCTPESSSNKASNIGLFAMQDEARISFDYLNPGDGFRISVLHTGDPYSVHLRGSIKGIQALKNWPLFPTNWARFGKKSISMDFGYVFLWLILVLGIFAGFVELTKPYISPIVVDQWGINHSMFKGERRVWFGILAILYAPLLYFTGLRRGRPPSYDPSLRDKMFMPSNN